MNHPPKNYPGFKVVSKSEFYDDIMKRNVHPTVVSGKWDNVYGYTSEFRTPSGHVKGIADSQHYYLPI